METKNPASVFSSCIRVPVFYPCVPGCACMSFPPLFSKIHRNRWRIAILSRRNDSFCQCVCVNEWRNVCFSDFFSYFAPPPLLQPIISFFIKRCVLNSPFSHGSILAFFNFFQLFLFPMEWNTNKKFFNGICLRFVFYFQYGHLNMNSVLNASVSVTNSPTSILRNLATWVNTIHSINVSQLRTCPVT